MTDIERHEEVGNAPVIYLDVVFLVNFMMDWVILWSVGFCLWLPLFYSRITIGAMLGALYAVVIVLPPLNFLATIGVKILYSLLMVWIAFPRQSWKMFYKTVGCFYLVSFLAGGAVMGGVYLFQDMGAVANYNGVLAFVNLPVHWLLVGFMSLGIVSLIGLAWFRRHLYKIHYSVPVVINIGGRRIAAKALVDTGNHLRDPLTHTPVIVAEEALFKNIMPISLKSLELNWEEVASLFKGTWWEARIRLLPFHSVGAAKGMLLGFVSDGVHIDLGHQTIYRPKVIIGIYHGTLSQEGQYQALLHPELIQMDPAQRKGVA